LMSMLGSSILHQIIQSTLSDSPKLILKYLDIQLQNLMSNAGGRQGDGIDIVLCVFDRRENLLRIASTNRPYLMISNGVLSEFRGSRVAIGNSEQPGLNGLEEHTLTLGAADVMYFFTDGLTDQFDRNDRKKYSLKRLKDFLMQIHHLPMDLQQEKLEEEIGAWQSDTLQTDDMLLFGIRRREATITYTE
jgi:hypothetical protein